MCALQQNALLKQHYPVKSDIQHDTWIMRHIHHAQLILRIL